MLVERGYRSVVAIAIATGILSAGITIFMGRPDTIRGGKSVAKYLLSEDNNARSFVYLFHQRNSGDAMNPQLAWYTQGWMAGWSSEHTYAPYNMPADSVDVTALVKVVSSNEPFVVYYHPGRSTEEVLDVTERIAMSYRVDLQTDHYTLYRRSW